MLLAAAISVIVLFLVSSGLALRGQKVQAYDSGVSGVNENRSQVLLTGKNYSLNYEQEQEHLEEKAKEKEKQEDRQKKVEEQQQQITQPEPENKPENIVEREEQRREQERQETDPPEQEQTPRDDSGNKEQDDQERDQSPRDDQDSKDDGDGEDDSDTPGPSEEAGDGDTEPGTDGGNDSGDGDEGDNPSENPDDPEAVTNNPIIECSLTDGETIAGSDIYFTLKGTDYKGRTIDSFYYSVSLDGEKMYSQGTNNGYTTYRQRDLTDNSHEVRIIVTDVEGNSTTVIYNVSTDSASSGEAETVTGYLYLDASHIGRGTLLYGVDYEVHTGSSVADFVEGALAAYGYTPMRGAGSSFYLARIYRPGIVGDASGLTIPPEFEGEAYPEGQDADSLGEKDIVATSGWLYMVNGVYMNVGMGSVTLEDGDEVFIWFTLDPSRDLYI